MNFVDFVSGLFINLPWSVFVRESVWAFPVLECIHVVAIVTVVGSIMVVDLRLLGLTSKHVPVRELSHDTLGWTWKAFAVALLTGLAMFVAKANEYLILPAFYLKFACMAVAGLNMIFFERRTFRSVDAWNHGVSTPAAAKVAGAISITFWLLVIVFGRWIGFTVGGGAVFGGGF